MIEYNVILAKTAERDIRCIYEYFAYQRKEELIAKRLTRNILKQIGSLKNLPGRTPLCSLEPWETQGLHQLLIGNYFVYYFIDENAMQVNVFRVIYGKSNLSKQINNE